MNKQQVPKIVAEVLKEISEKVKEFNKSSGIKLVVKSFDDFLLQIYPDDNHSFFFQIDKYEVEEMEVYFWISINIKSDKLIDAAYTVKKVGYSGWMRRFFQFPIEYSPKKNIVTDTFSAVVTIQLFEAYLNTLRDLDKIINTKLNLSEIFDLEVEEEPLPPEPNYFEETDKILPYSLKQLAVKDFQGIKELSIESIPVDAQWVFLVGENGFGKTTILQAMFLGLNGPLDGGTNLVEDKNSSIQVEYKSLEDSYINGIKENHRPLVHLAAYGPGRLNVQGAKSENAEDRNNSVSYNLFNSDGFLFNINADLQNFEARDKKRFTLLKKAICTLVPNIADIKYNKETNQIEYIEQEINVNSEEKAAKYQPLPFKKLASGFKSTIALAGDMIVRLSKTQPDVKDPAELKGIVLIDEIDLHLHPKLQKQLIGQFSKVFPKIQFIVSTHSPIPLLGAASNSVILKVKRTEAEGINIEKVNIDLKNLTPNLILTSGIFDMEDFVSVQNESIYEVRTEDSFAKMQENDRVEAYLKDFEKSDASFPDELFMPKSKQVK